MRRHGYQGQRRSEPSMSKHGLPTAGSRGSLLEGIWASVPTPFRDDGEVDYAAVARNAIYYSDGLALTGIYCNGIMGEGWSLTLQERMDIVRVIMSAAGDSLLLGVVVTAGSLKETIHLARHAEETGVHHVVVSPPPGLFTADETFRYLEQVREAVSIPLVLVEASSGGFGRDFMALLALRSGLVAAVKVGSSRDDVAALHKLLGDKVQITDPCEANWLANLQDFEMNVLYADPEPYLFQTRSHRPIESYCTAFLRGRPDKAMAVAQSLDGFRQLYDRWIMHPLRAGIAPIAALKAWSEWMGLAAGSPRVPISSLDRTVRIDLNHQLERLRAKTN